MVDLRSANAGFQLALVAGAAVLLVALLGYRQMRGQVARCA